MQLPQNNSLSALRDHFQTKLNTLYEKSEIDQLYFITCEYHLGLKRSEIITNAQQKISESELLKIHFTLKELITAKPIQYILSETYFYGLKLKISPAVLIPRPETEELVELAIQLVKNKNQRIKSVLDLCTGSGCIPLAIKNSLKELDVKACDISNEALNIAIHNAKELKLKVDFFELDVLNDLVQYKPANKFDIITSNPPYIPEKDKNEMHKNVLEFEPHLALFVQDDDPLIFYRKIAEHAKGLLSENGILLLEIHEKYANELLQLFTLLTYKNVQIHTDLQGKPRVLQAEI